MQLKGWNSAIAPAAVVMALTYQALVKRWDAAAVETGDRAAVGAA